MVQILKNTAPDFESAFETLLLAKREQSEDVDLAVRDILNDVKARGDEALYDLSAKFDSVDLRSVGLRFSQEEIDSAYNSVDPELIEALKLARDRIDSHHSRQKPKDDIYEDALGVKLGGRWTAVDSAGLYVPGGTAAYPSSVLMNAVPAKVAGVKRITMVVPTPRGEVNPLVLAAAKLAGVDEIYRVGGAQAVGALAFGTQTIRAVAKIVGPGNAYVAAAKRQVYGTVGIDMIAGPSEVLILADGKNNPEWIAADLLAQAEHDTAAQSILITNDADFADQVAQAVDRQLEALPRGEIARASWENFGAIIIVDELENSYPLANRIAAEHLEIATDTPEDILPHINNAGSIFLGHFTPEAMGDYVAGPNHVLPTARSARFSSGLGVLDFMKRSSVLKMTKESLQTLGPSAMILAHAEGLDAHRLSVDIRLGEQKE